MPLIDKLSFNIACSTIAEQLTIMWNTEDDTLNHPTHPLRNLDKMFNINNAGIVQVHSKYIDAFYDHGIKLKSGEPNIRTRIGRINGD